MKNKSLLLLSFSLLLLSYDANSQSNLKSSVKAGLYTEFFGNTGHISVNFDLRWVMKSKSNLALRAGFGGAFFSTSGFPVELLYLYGKNAHVFETGPGINFLNDDDLLFSFRMGYRYQQKDKSGVFFRLGFVPYYRNNYWDEKKSGKIQPYGGISIGYSF